MRDPDLLRDHGVFIAEGRLVVQRLLERSSYRPRSVLVIAPALSGLADVLRVAPCPVFLAPPELVTTLTGFNVHRGCLAIADRGSAASIDRLLAKEGPLVILENVGNPDNVGGTFRNAAAFGASAVLLSRGCSDPLYRKAIRTSMGAALTVPFSAAEPWPAVLEQVRSHDWTLVSLTPSSDAAELSDAAAAIRGRRIALLLGHEGSGLTEDAQRFSDVRARIPMAKGTDSLNVATAAAVALYEFRRAERRAQRRAERRAQREK